MEEQSPRFGGGLQSYAQIGLSSGKIKNIKDIMNYKKLLLANIPIQNQALQTGQHNGLINIGGNSGNQ